MSKTPDFLFSLVRRALVHPGTHTNRGSGTTRAAGTCCHDGDTLSAMPSQCGSDGETCSQSSDSSPPDRSGACGRGAAPEDSAAGLSTPVMRERRILFLLASSRTGGNSEWLARRAAESLPDNDEVRWLRLIDLDLDTYRDRREEQPRTPWPSGDADALLRQTLAADDLVLVAPLYWYGPPTPLKHYLDHWSAWLRLAAVDFRAVMRGKRLWLVCALSDGEPAKADPLVAMLRLTADYMGMEFAGVLLGHGNRRGDLLGDRQAVAAADHLFAAARTPQVGATPATVASACPALNGQSSSPALGELARTGAWIP